VNCGGHKSEVEKMFRMQLDANKLLTPSALQQFDLVARSIKAYVGCVIYTGIKPSRFGNGTYATKGAIFGNEPIEKTAEKLRETLFDTSWLSNIEFATKSNIDPEVTLSAIGAMSGSIKAFSRPMTLVPKLKLCGAARVQRWVHDYELST
jgi:hypothetical protein